MWLLRRLHALNYKVGNKQITHLPRRRSSMKDLGGSEIPGVSRVLAHSSWWNQVRKTVPECLCESLAGCVATCCDWLIFSVYWRGYHTHARLTHKYDSTITRLRVAKCNAPFEECQRKAKQRYGTLKKCTTSHSRR